MAVALVKRSSVDDYPRLRRLDSNW